MTLVIPFRAAYVAMPMGTCGLFRAYHPARCAAVVGPAMIAALPINAAPTRSVEAASARNPEGGHLFPAPDPRMRWPRSRPSCYVDPKEVERV